jgi:hypothetical protein
MFDKVLNGGGGAETNAPSSSDAQIIEHLASLSDDDFSRYVIRNGGTSPQRAIIKQAMTLRAERKLQPVGTARPDGPAFDLGVPTGRLLERNHSAGMRKGDRIRMTCWDLYEGFGIIGQMGSGKTRCILTRLARAWLDYPGSGLLANGIKPEWSRTLVRIAKHAGRSDDEIHVIGPNGKPWNLLHGLPPDAVGYFVKSAFDLDGHNRGGHQFFTTTAMNLVTSAAMILFGLCPDASVFECSFTSPNGEGSYSRTFRYSLADVYELIFMQDAEWKAFREAAAERARWLSDRDRRDLSQSIVFGLRALERELLAMLGETKASVLGQVATCLSKFVNDPIINETYCGGDTFDLACLDQGHVVIPDISLSEYPATAELVYLLTFEHLRQRMMARQSMRIRIPLMLMMDEYTSVAIDKHGPVLRLARESNIAVVLAYQLQSDLQNRVGGADAGRAIVNNLRNLIVFGTGDSPTLQLVKDWLGKSEVPRESTSRQRGRSLQQPGFGSVSGPGTSWSETTSSAIVERDVVDQQLMRTLRRRFVRGEPLSKQFAEAIAILSVDQQPRDDVVILNAWDPPEE